MYSPTIRGPPYVGKLVNQAQLYALGLTEQDLKKALLRKLNLQKTKEMNEALRRVMDHLEAAYALTPEGKAELQQQQEEARKAVSG